jgi:hypothetical protein
MAGTVGIDVESSRSGRHKPTSVCVSRERLDYLASCEKFDQSIYILWRQKLSDGTTPQIPQNHGLPVYSVYGVRAELKMRDIDRLGCGVTGIVQALYGTGVQVIPIRSEKWSFNAAMGKPEEKIDLPGDVMAQVCENPRACAGSHPMATRTREASRAGSLRGGVGSGSNGDTSVAQGNPFSKPGS